MNQPVFDSLQRFLLTEDLNAAAELLAGEALQDLMATHARLCPTRPK